MKNFDPDALMREWGLAKEEEIRPCPNCGQTPQFVLGKRSGRYDIGMRFECRRWFGLKLCFAPDWRYDDVEDANSYGRRGAIVRWNAAVK